MNSTTPARRRLPATRDLRRGTTPGEIITAAHVAAPLVWRAAVSDTRRAEATQAVRGALQMQRHRARRALLARRLHPPFSHVENELLKDAARQYRALVWFNFFYNPAAATAADRADRKARITAALVTIERLRAVELAAAPAADTPV